MDPIISAASVVAAALAVGSGSDRPWHWSRGMPLVRQLKGLLVSPKQRARFAVRCC